MLVKGNEKENGTGRWYDGWTKENNATLEKKQVSKRKCTREMKYKTRSLKSLSKRRPMLVLLV
jgi:hypothetical protein